MEKEEEDEQEDEKDDFSTSFQLEPSECHAFEKANIRAFIVPKINFKATSYPDLIDWETAIFSEPPMTMSLSKEEILEFVETPMTVPNYPCHTQAVERTIKLVTDAAGSVIGPEARDGFMRQKIKSRKEIGRIDSKKEFFQKFEKPQTIS